MITLGLALAAAAAWATWRWHVRASRQYTLEEWLEAMRSRGLGVK